MGTSSSYDLILEKLNSLVEATAELACIYTAVGTEYANLYVKQAARLLLLEKKYDALACFSEALLLNPNCVEAYAWRGRIHIDLRNYETAIADFTRALEIDPDKAEYFRELGVAYDKLGQVELSLYYLKLAIAKDSRLASAYFSMGVIFFNQKQYAEALKYYEMAASLGERTANRYAKDAQKKLYEQSR